MSVIVKSYSYNFVLYILLFSLVSSCAIIIPPTGGPKDSKAPVAQKSIPESGKTNFKGGIVIILFDEEIEVDPNPSKVIISPPLDSGQIEIKERKKKYLEITIPHTLKNNTTYTININNAVKDITEANVVKNISFAFSTGPKLDSLSIKGKTINIETKQSLKEILVALYPKTDSAGLKQKPLYLSYSDELGNFNLSYLKEGDYYLQAFEDKNKNLLLDNQEKVDFLSNINPSLSSENLKLELSIYDTTGNKLLTKKNNQNQQNLSYRNGIKTYSYRVLNPNDTLYVLLDRKKTKELNTFVRTFSLDTLAYIVKTTDSLDNTTEDTLTLIKPKKEPKPTLYQLTPKTKDLLPGTEEIVFLSNKPIYKIIEDSITINDQPVEKISYNSLRDSLYIPLNKDQKRADTLKIKFAKSAVIFFDNDSSKTNNNIIPKADPSNYSVLEMNIKTTEPNYIIQLLSEDYTIIDEYKNITILKYDYINPGNYRIRAILDKNNNGHWDRVDPSKKSKAEPIIYYNNDKLTLKPNWELKDLMFIF